MSEERKPSRGFIVWALLLIAFVFSCPPANAAATGGTGDLYINCYATKGGVDSTDSFDFTLTISETSGSYSCETIGADGTPINTPQLANGSVSFALANGERFSCKGLPDGTSYTVTATPKAGYQSSLTSTNGTISGSAGIDFRFTSQTFEITAIVQNGTITASESGIPFGESRTVSYSPDAFHTLLSVKVDDVDVTATNPTSYTFDNIADDHRIVVVYEPETYTITTSVTGGTITPSVSGIKQGESRGISYTPNANYTLKSVTVDGMDFTTTAPTGITFSNISTNHSVVVVYEAQDFTITTSVTGGTITPSESGIKQGESRTISYTPDANYALKSVTIDGVDLTATAPTGFTFSNISTDHSITVVYEAQAVTPPTPPTPAPPTPAPVTPTTTEGVEQAKEPEEIKEPEPAEHDQDPKPEQAPPIPNDPAPQQPKTSFWQKVWEGAAIPMFAVSAVAGPMMIMGLLSDIRLLRWVQQKGPNPKEFGKRRKR